MRAMEITPAGSLNMGKKQGKSLVQCVQLKISQTALEEGTSPLQYVSPLREVRPNTWNTKIFVTINGVDTVISNK
jgi:hypothetical protein